MIDQIELRKYEKGFIECIKYNEDRAKKEE